MERTKIYFGSFERVISFVQLVDHTDVMLKLVTGTKRVDGKSILGIFSLNLHEPMTLEITGNKKSREKFMKSIHEFVRE